MATLARLHCPRWVWVISIVTGIALCWVIGPVGVRTNANVAAATATPLIVYDDALQNGFVERSSGLTALDLCVRNRYASAPCGIVASFAPLVGTLAFETAAPFSAAPYATFEFNYGAEPGYIANFEVRLLGVGGDTLGKARLGEANLAPGTAPGFQHIVVPLVYLDPTGAMIKEVQLVNTGGALVGIGFDDLQFVASPPPTCPTGQFMAQYFATPDLSGPVVLARCEATIDHAWGYDGPGGAVPVDNFSAHWQGRFAFAAGTYTFTALADDGIRVTLDGVALIDGWRDQQRTSYTASRTLAAGDHDVVVEYYERDGLASAHFGWATPTAVATPTVPAVPPTPSPAPPTPPAGGGYTITQALPPCRSGQWQTTLDTANLSFTVVCKP